MPSPKKPCPDCGNPMSPLAQKCRACAPLGHYSRTPEHKQRMSELLQERPKPWLLGRKRPDHAAAMRAWWTPERREARRRAALARNPQARYHGLSAKAAAALVRRVGRCTRCGHDGSTSHLDVHHRDRNKHNQAPENLDVLCHQCHMQEHRYEIGRGAKRRPSALPD